MIEAKTKKKKCETKFIAFGNLKGGVAKTTTCYNVAGFLAQEAESKRILLIDLDPQGNLTTCCNVNRRQRNLLGIENVFYDEVTLNPEDFVIKAPIEDIPNLDIFPSTIQLHAVSVKLAYAAAKEFRLYNFILEHEDFFSQYEYVIMDTNPSMGLLNQNAFYVADSIVIPMIADESAVDGTQLFFSLWDSLRIPLKKEDNIDCVVLTRRNTNYGTDKDFREQILNDPDAQDVASALADTVIDESVSIKRASKNHSPVCMIKNKKSKGYLQYELLVNELRKRGTL